MVTIHQAGSRRTSAELEALLHFLVLSDGFCSDPLLRLELLATGLVRRDPNSRLILHLTRDGRRFLGDS